MGIHQRTNPLIPPIRCTQPYPNQYPFILRIPRPIVAIMTVVYASEKRCYIFCSDSVQVTTKSIFLAT